MPKLTCRCGNTINLSPIPNDQGFMLIWEPLIEKFVDELTTANTESKSEFESKAYELIHRRKPQFPQIYECLNCGRLAIFTNASDSEPTFWFKPEYVNGNADSISALLQHLVVAESLRKMISGDQ